MYFPEIDHAQLVKRTKIMQEYGLDHRKYYKDFKEETSMIESIYSGNSYVSISNRDNLPTHEMKAEDGTVKRYCGASKNWRKVDPTVTDPHSLHNASQQRVYLLVKNKYTKEWEFPSKAMYGSDTFIKARQDVFRGLTDDKWIIRHQPNYPKIATLRPFTEAEKSDTKNSILSGVRTFYFDAFHLRGFSDFNFDETDYEDYAWLPKTKIGNYLNEERMGMFYDYFLHR